MFYKPFNCAWILLIVFLKIRCHSAEVVNNTATNKAPGITSVATRFFDLNGGDGNPNLQEPGRFGNSASNYPENPFLAFGNQGPQRGYGWNPNTGIFQGRPYQGPGNYPVNQGNRPYQPGSNNFGPGFNPNYPRLSYPNGPGGNIMYPGNINRPYQNGGVPNQGGYPNRPIGFLPDDISYIPQGRYPLQGNYQGNPNSPYSNGFNHIPNTYIHYPSNNIPYPNRPGQYPPGNNLVNQDNVNIRPNNNYPYLNNDAGNNMRYPPNNHDKSGSPIRFQNNGPANAMQGNNNLSGTNQVPPSNMNRAPQSQFSSNQRLGPPNDSNANDTAAVLGKPDQPVFGGR